MIGSVEGTVEEINLRTTIIRTGNDTIITVPNATLVSTPWKISEREDGEDG